MTRDVGDYGDLGDTYPLPAHPNPSQIGVGLLH
jgi:hypothetical protein